MVQAIAIMTLVNGILNILASLGVTLGIVLGTFGLGLLCAPITIAPLVLGIFEIIYGVNLMAEPPKVTKPNQVIAILEICCIIIGNVISLVVGILALVFYNDEEVKAYFNQLSA
jgi:hypothetical protein